jgi:hypothetical protein
MHGTQEKATAAKPWLSAFDKTLFNLSNLKTDQCITSFIPNSSIFLRTFYVVQLFFENTI